MNSYWSCFCDLDEIQVNDIVKTFMAFADLLARTLSRWNKTPFLNLSRHSHVFFQAPYWVTPFIVPVLGRTKVGDPSLAHLTMLKKQTKKQTNKQTSKLDKLYFIVQNEIVYLVLIF